MINYASASTYLKGTNLSHLPNEIKNIVPHCELGTEHAADRSRMKIQSIADWWFTLVEGRGTLHMRSMPYFEPPPGYALLSMSWSGHVTSSSLPIGAATAGQIGLRNWSVGYDVLSRGEFSYLIAHIPTADLCMSEADLEEMGRLTAANSWSVYTGAGAILAGLLRNLAEEASRAEDSDTLRELLPSVSQLARQVFSSSEQTCRGKEDVRLARIMSFLEAHLDDSSLSSDSVAAACGLSRRQLFRVLENGPENFSQKLRNLRLQRAAAMLLRDPTRSIPDIAYSCGFGSASAFVRNFQMTFEQTPSAYRKSVLRIRK